MWITRRSARDQGHQASPWCDFSAVDSTIFHPGDQILLKRGDTFTTGMLLQGSGTSTSYLTVSAYGSGATPIINGGNSLSFTGLNLVNTNYVQVENLSFEDSGIGALINSGESTSGLPIIGSLILRGWHWNPIQRGQAPRATYLSKMWKAYQIL